MNAPKRPASFQRAMEFLPDQLARDLCFYINDLQNASADAARWRKLVSMLGHVQDGSADALRVSLDDATLNYVITSVSSKTYWFGRTLSEAIDNVPETDA